MLILIDEMVSYLLPVLFAGKLHWFIVDGVIDTCEVVACNERVVCMNDFFT